MAGLQCAIIPTVFNEKGEKVESKLFRDLLTYSNNNRDFSNNIYEITKSNDFIRGWDNRLSKDENGEYTLQSLIEKTNLSSRMDERNIIKALNKQLGAVDSRGKLIDQKVTTTEDLIALRERARDFNKDNPFRKDYVADVTKSVNDRGKEIYVLAVQRRNTLNSIEAEKMDYNTTLNQKLRNILESKGIKIGALTELERRRGLNGVTDFDTAKDAATGLIELIRIAEGKRGEAALPEEFAHFALAALQSDPLVRRLVKAVSSEQAIERILGKDFDTYNVAYKGDWNKLAMEAAGKLLSKHLLENEPTSGTYKTFLDRVIDKIKDFFRGFQASEIERAIEDADKSAGELAKSIMSGRMDEKMNVENISSSGMFLSTEEEVDKKLSLIQRIINKELKRLKIYEARNPKDKITRDQKLLINELEKARDSHREIEGIYKFLSSALKNLTISDKALSSLNDNNTMTAADKASALRELRNTLYSYKSMVEELQAELAEDELTEAGEFGDDVKEVVDRVVGLTSRLEAKYQKVAVPMFIDFIKPFIGDNIRVPFGKFKNKVYTLDELVKTADRDISIFDRWLDSVAESSDLILKVMDRAVKVSKNKARRRVIELSKEIKAAGILLEKAGIKDMDWMFEKDSEGKKTGKYISKLDWTTYNSERNALYDRLKGQYGEAWFMNKEARTIRDTWLEKNTIREGDRSVPNDKYVSEAYKRLNPDQKKFYDNMMEIKAELDSFLPDGYTSLTNAVQLRKDLLERLKTSDSVSGAAKELWENVKDGFIERTDDTDIGIAPAIKDFEEQRVQKLPVYFTKKLENPEDISTDVVSTMVAYASMAVDFDEMSKIIDQLEMGRDVLKERQITQTQGNRTLMESFKAAGRTVEEKLFNKGGTTKFMGRLNDFFEMQVYGRYMADEGTLGNSKVSKAKLANQINRLTSFNNLALNLLAGISNVATGSVMMRIEAFSGEFFNEKDVLIGDKNYAKYLPKFLSNIGNRIKTDKLSLWNEHFDVMQEYEQEIKNTEFDRKTWFSKMFGANSLFFLSNSGEHWMQTRTSLAAANAVKLKDKNGKEISLFDAYEEEAIIKEGVKVGARLKLMDGVTKLDGSKFTEEDEFNFQQRVKAINQGMHGIYNKADRSALQRLAIGRLAFLYRKWMKPSFNKRFNSARYNFDLGEWTEGYYLTSGKFLWNLTKDIARLQFHVAAHWGELTKTEKANIRRALTEMVHFLVLSVFLGLKDWDDDEDRPWVSKMAEYQAHRLYTELGAMVPGKSMFSEGFKILQQPAAGISVMQNSLNLLDVINPLAYMDEIESGRYKGHSRAYRSFMKSPLVPLYKTVSNVLDPNDAIAFFRQ